MANNGSGSQDLVNQQNEGSGSGSFLGDVDKFAPDQRHASVAKLDKEVLSEVAQMSEECEEIRKTLFPRADPTSFFEKFTSDKDFQDNMKKTYRYSSTLEKTEMEKQQNADAYLEWYQRIEFSVQPEILEERFTTFENKSLFIPDIPDVKITDSYSQADEEDCYVFMARCAGVFHNMRQLYIQNCYQLGKCIYRAYRIWLGPNCTTNHLRSIPDQAFFEHCHKNQIRFCQGIEKFSKEQLKACACLFRLIYYRQLTRLFLIDTPESTFIKYIRKLESQLYLTPDRRDKLDIHEYSVRRILTFWATVPSNIKIIFDGLGLIRDVVKVALTAQQVADTLPPPIKDAKAERKRQITLMREEKAKPRTVMETPLIKQKAGQSFHRTIKMTEADVKRYLQSRWNRRVSLAFANNIQGNPHVETVEDEVGPYVLPELQEVDDDQLANEVVEEEEEQRLAQQMANSNLNGGSSSSVSAPIGNDGGSGGESGGDDPYSVPREIPLEDGIRRIVVLRNPTTGQIIVYHSTVPEVQKNREVIIAEGHDGRDYAVLKEA